MTMDADECQSRLNLARQGTLTKLAVRQLGRLIGIYMLPQANSYLLWGAAAVKWTVYLQYAHKDVVEGHNQ